jgi:hypothetical protein
LLDTFEAKRKRHLKIVLGVERWRIGAGYYVTITILDSEPEKITDISRRKAKAWRWIKNESAAWLHARKETIAANSGGPI